MNTTVIIMMIICATIIALVAIICDHLFEKNSTDSKDCLLSKKIIKIHRNYIAGFLGFAVIMLITAEYGCDKEIFNYLSFASTITSFVLSILAIFVTVQSSSDLYKQFARIEDATTTIKSLSDTIEKDLPNISKVGTDIQNTSRALSAKLTTVVLQIEKIVKNRMAETENKIINILDSSNKGSEHIAESIDSDEVLEMLKNYFLASTSLNGLLAIYACSLSKDNNKKEFELSKLFEGNEAYIYGFLIATVSSQFIQLTDDTKTIKCEESGFECTEIKEAIKNRLNKIKDNDKQKYILDQINIIHEHFDVPTISSIDDL